MAESRKDFSNFVRHHSRRLTNIKNRGDTGAFYSHKTWWAGGYIRYEKTGTGYIALPFYRAWYDPHQISCQACFIGLGRNVYMHRILIYRRRRDHKKGGKATVLAKKRNLATFFYSVLFFKSIGHGRSREWIYEYIFPFSQCKTDKNKAK